MGTRVTKLRNSWRTEFHLRYVSQRPQHTVNNDTGARDGLKLRRMLQQNFTITRVPTKSGSLRLSYVKLSHCSVDFNRHSTFSIAPGHPSHSFLPFGRRRNSGLFGFIQPGCSCTRRGGFRVSNVADTL